MNHREESAVNESRHERDLRRRGDGHHPRTMWDASTVGAAESEIEHRAHSEFAAPAG